MLNASTGAKLYHVSVTGQRTIVTQVDLSHSALNQQDAFVLDAGARVYVVCGENVSQVEKNAANVFAEGKVAERGSDNANVTHEVDDDFWELVGGVPDFLNSSAQGSDINTSVLTMETFEVESEVAATGTGGSARSRPLLSGSTSGFSHSTEGDRRGSSASQGELGSSMVTSGVQSGRQADWEDMTPIEEVQELAREYPDMQPQVHEVMHRLGGNARFRWGGKFITGPESVDCRFNTFTWIAILAPTVFYFYTCATPLWNKPDTKWLPLLTAVLFILCITLLVLTSWTDPGIIPRYSLRLIVPGLEEQVAEALGIAEMNIDIANGTRDEGQMMQLETRGFRWCAFCKMLQPPRAKHCRDCDNCVLRNDHHCPFVNNCIGQRNYVYFCGFLFSIVCLGISVFLGIYIWFSNESGMSSKVDAAHRKMFLIALAVPTAIFLVCVLGLSFFHFYLILRGRTTREVLTGRNFGEGATLTGHRGASLIPGRARVVWPPRGA